MFKNFKIDYLELLAKELNKKKPKLLTSVINPT